MVSFISFINTEQLPINIVMSTVADFSLPSRT